MGYVAVRIVPVMRAMAGGLRSIRPRLCLYRSNGATSSILSCWVLLGPFRFFSVGSLRRAPVFTCHVRSRDGPFGAGQQRPLRSPLALQSGAPSLGQELSPVQGQVALSLHATLLTLNHAIYRDLICFMCWATTADSWALTTKTRQCPKTRQCEAFPVCKTISSVPSFSMFLEAAEAAS